MTQNEGQWFAEVKSSDDNDRLREYLNRFGYGDENEAVLRQGTDGRPHSVVELPKWLVHRLRRLKLEKKGIDPIFQYRFWKCDSPRQEKIRPADFLEKPKRPVIVKSALRHKQRSRRAK